jgi:hypothetical protein
VSHQHALVVDGVANHNRDIYDRQHTVIVAIAADADRHRLAPTVGNEEISHEGDCRGTIRRAKSEYLEFAFTTLIQRFSRGQIPDRHVYGGAAVADERLDDAECALDLSNVRGRGTTDTHQSHAPPANLGGHVQWHLTAQITAPAGGRVVYTRKQDDRRFLPTNVRGAFRHTSVARH